MKVNAKKEFWSDGATVDVLGADVAVLLQDVTGVGVSGGSNCFVSLRFYRVDSVLGSISLPLLEAVALVAKLESLGVDINGDLDVPEVA
ncbi:hypothetical protein [Moritella sp.]|uniref:hypothetical protein n=1 Tax=Moritella sp. TaxID=78556 RepID=UPI001E10E74D|nr:hypothetical protein [Moritella sp.]MCJ8348041.1 hypothetical protein [Moritella sp.]NQZ42632.1 hypothetical protein [Moritella sp.]